MDVGWGPGDRVGSPVGISQYSMGSPACRWDWIVPKGLWELVEPFQSPVRVRPQGVGEGEHR